MKYAYQAYDEAHMARAYGSVLPISLKKTVVICDQIRGKKVADSIKMLKRVEKMDQAIPFERYNKGGIGHKPGMGPGRYPIATSVEVRKILEEALANAQFKGLNTSNLVIVHVAAQKTAKQWHYGRKRRRSMKRANLEVVVAESSEKAEKSEKPKNEKPKKGAQ